MNNKSKQIVRLVNSHDDLLDALIEAVGVVRSVSKNVDGASLVLGVWDEAIKEGKAVKNET